MRLAEFWWNQFPTKKIDSKPWRISPLCYPRSPFFSFEQTNQKVTYWINYLGHSWVVKDFWPEVAVVEQYWWHSIVTQVSTVSHPHKENKVHQKIRLFDLKKMLVSCIFQPANGCCTACSLVKICFFLLPFHCFPPFMSFDSF